MNVAVRISHPDSRDLSLSVANPAFKGFQLRENGHLNDPKGADFGAGPASCAGALDGARHPGAHLDPAGNPAVSRDTFAPLCR